MILVTGGAGYIGSHTVKALAAKGYECVVADNLVYGHREAVAPEARFEKADLLETESLKKIFKKYEIDAVIHFAALLMSAKAWKTRRNIIAIMVVGTLNYSKMRAASADKSFFEPCATYVNPNGCR